MNRLTIREQYNSQPATAAFGDRRPTAYASSKPTRSWIGPDVAEWRRSIWLSSIDRTKEARRQLGFALRSRASRRVQRGKPSFFGMRKNGCQLHTSAPGFDGSDCGPNAWGAPNMIASTWRGNCPPLPPRDGRGRGPTALREGWPRPTTLLTPWPRSSPRRTICSTRA